MEGEGTTVETVEVDLGAGGANPVVNEAPPQEFSGKPGDLAKDLAFLAKEQQQTQEPPKVENVTETVEPEQPATAPATPVPDKFKNPDGSVNQEKVTKSTVSAEEALAKYAELERKLRQKQNEVAALKSGAPVPAVPPSTPVPVSLSPFEIQVAQDLINEAAAAGQPIHQAHAIAQARVMVKMMEAKHSAEAQSLQSLNQKLEDQERRRELEVIRKRDPWVFTSEGIEKLTAIREEKGLPSWTAAYREYLADLKLAEMMQDSGEQVQTPTPTGKTAKAPPTPVNPAPRVVVKPSEPNYAAMSPDEINAHLAKMTPEQEAAFWKSRGLRFR